MPEGAAAQLTWQVASALDHLHGLEMAHRDVKPGNILFDGPLGAAEPWLRVKLCDFGFAIRCANKRLKKQVGTPQYVAPELTIPPDAHAGYRGRPVDMWALGAVLYETLHGKHAFYGSTLEQLETRIRAASHEPIEKNVPPIARGLILALLTQDPEKRMTARAALAHSYLKQGRRESELRATMAGEQREQQQLEEPEAAAPTGSADVKPQRAPAVDVKVVRIS